MKFFDLFNKKGEPLSITPNIDIPKMEWKEFLDFIGYSEKDVKGNVDQLQIILTPFMVDLYKYKFNMPVDLNGRIILFESWFKKNLFCKYSSIDVGELSSKLASWYEMRYPDNALKEMLSSERIDICNCFDFKGNQYINDNFTDDSDVHFLELAKTLNFRFFINTLSKDEREIFRKKRPKASFVKADDGSTYFLTPNGFVLDYFNEELGIYDKYYDSKHITDVLDFSKDSIDVWINATRERFKTALTDSYKGAFARKELLNCAMYKLLSNHNTMYGTLRSLLFAHEFGLDIDVPMIYGIDRNRFVRQEINFYLKFGGSKDLECYINYFDEDYQNGMEPLDKMSISDMIADYSGCYTIEERFLQQKLCDVLASHVSSSKELYQKLATVLHSCIDQKELAKEKAKLVADADELRRREVIQRRLEKKKKGYR